MALLTRNTVMLLPDKEASLKPINIHAYLSFPQSLQEKYNNRIKKIQLQPFWSLWQDGRKIAKLVSPEFKWCIEKRVTDPEEIILLIY